jgi:signal transduction histidine kinase
VAVKLRVARSQLEVKPGISARLLDEALHELGAGLEELREIARGLHPAILGEHGLGRALEVLAERLPVAVTLDVLSERLPDHLEATTYYIVSEALTNVVKHANAGEARVTVAREGDVLRCEIADDGRGGADASRGSGITGLRDRAEAAGGTLSVISPPDRGTVITAVLALTS